MNRHSKPRSVHGFFVAIAMSMAALGSGCGAQSSFLDNINARTYQQDGDLWAEMKAQLNTGSMVLMGIDVPVVDPKTGRSLGHLSMRSSFCDPTGVCGGGGELAIALNLTQIGNVPMIDNKLPNGTSIPVGGVAQNVTIGIPIGDTGAKVYVGMSQGVALLGVALPFKALDGVGKYVPGVNIFQPFQIEKVRGLAGLFAGNTTKSTGIGLFVDLSSVINLEKSVESQGVVASLSSALSRVVSIEGQDQEFQPLELKAVRPSKSRENLFYQHLNKANSKKTKLILQ